VAVVACGAIARHVSEIAQRRGWAVDVHPLPPLLHNRPERIAGAVETAVGELRGRYAAVAVGFADCGSYGALDEVCDRLGVPRLRALLAAEPGTYLLTDYLALSFERSVIVELGLDRWPELHEEYFRHYRRVVWLAQHPTPRVRAAAQRAADYLRLPLQERSVGDAGLEQALAELLSRRPSAAPAAAATPPGCHRAGAAAAGSAAPGPGPAPAG
jgi:hypothetical protein